VKRFMSFLALAAVLVMLIGTATAAAALPPLTPIQRLGKMLFFDTNLSDPPGQSCATCHAPEVGFTGPDSEINAAGAVYEGAVPGRFGNRKPPAAAYAGDSPILYYNGSAWVGGMFWDGRATGWMLGDPLAEQAMGPFLNPLEQNMSDPAAVVAKVKASGYASLFEKVWGIGSLANDSAAENYERIGRSIAAYERSPHVSKFTSRYDGYLKTGTGLTAKEQWGLQLFEGKAKCSGCHPSRPGPDGKPPMFTDYTYDNLGIPKNPANPFYFEPEWNPLGTAWIDLGLGDFLAHAGFPSSVSEPEMGKFKVPTLRNVAKKPYSCTVKAYAHNGYFKSLQAIVHFYNTRDVAAWPAPEYAPNMNTAELGNLKLTAVEEGAIVAFLRTLSDR
jgi:cytochrome c peroxidase